MGTLIDIFGERVDISETLGPFVSHIFDKLGDKVLSGPFAGMRVGKVSSWTDCSVDKLYGVYERELHAAVERAIARGPKTVVNVGCSNGYYAIGFAHRLPEAIVHAFDIESRALDLCDLYARLNGVSSRVRSHSGCRDPEELFVGTGGPLLYFLDCEGAEFKLLNPERCPSLRSADIIVEYHSFGVSKWGGYVDLVRRFQDTHDLDVISPIKEEIFQLGVQFPPPPGQEDPIPIGVSVTSGRCAEQNGWLALWAKGRDA